MSSGTLDPPSKLLRLRNYKDSDSLVDEAVEKASYIPNHPFDNNASSTLDIMLVRSLLPQFVAALQSIRPSRLVRGKRRPNPKYETLSTCVRHCNSFLSRAVFLSLPQEILSEIFHFLHRAVDPQHRFKTTLTLRAVCARWNNLVLHSPRLWRTITVHWYPREPSRGLVNLFLERSRPFGLQVLIVDTAGRLVLAQSAWRLPLSIVEWLHEALISPRLHTISVRTSCPRKDRFSAHLIRASCHNLQNVEIARWTQPLREAVLLCKNLVCMSIPLPSINVKFEFSSRLQVLSITVPSNCAPSLFARLRGAPTLQELKITIEDIFAPHSSTSQTTTVVLPSLHRLEIVIRRHLSFLDLCLGALEAPQVHKLIVTATSSPVLAVWPERDTGSFDFLQRHSESLEYLCSTRIPISVALADCPFFGRRNTRLRLRADPKGPPIPTEWFDVVSGINVTQSSVDNARRKAESMEAVALAARRLPRPNICPTGQDLVYSRE
ncbi:hypothetical protein CYLTODRAFT_495522 [Cylindrobasidium torrendii FP15055 ss-10]|uniref:F-box domain-containing protein n=1 Tax=Cylindrobasidium torrendii FP15055 ss-10 TaxID=1314674 RepID=A0A0D7AS01_9AGAR|nr:hypothetical protein CYLTODRAFT_495522 [Cylindrobasidium torrendii FP15055 ss-10]